VRFVLAALRAVALGLIRGYKLMVSPFLPPACRFLPTCSEYAAEAVQRHGVVRGSAKAAWRLLRCHPFCEGGYDPVVSTERIEAKVE
jgi:putative membrane protein insertion efficiency factor